MVHLEHLFARGIRFDTEVQYLAQGPRDSQSLRYEDLPVRKSACARECTITSVIQCVAVLAQMPRTVAMRKLRRALQAGKGETVNSIDDRDVLKCITAFGADVVTDLPSSDSASEIGSAAWAALRAGQIGMLWFETPRGRRWATLIGVERDRITQQVRVLLLLDASASEPWACAHNVRIELESSTGSGAHASPGVALRCRHLTGEASGVRLLGLMVLTVRQR